MHFVGTRAWIAVILVIFAFHEAALAESVDFREAMNLTTMAEASAGAFFSLAHAAIVKPTETFQLSGTYSSAGWSSSIFGSAGGQALALAYTGNLNGNFGTPISISFNGSGNLGTMALSPFGNTTWSFTGEQNDYANMQFSLRGIDRRVLVGAEILLGGVIGGVVTRTWGGAGVGADTALTLSSILEAFLDPDLPLPPTPPLPPQPPPSTPTPRPPFPKNGLTPTTPGSGLPPTPPGSGLTPTSQAVTAIYTDLGVLHHNHGDTILLSIQYGAGTFTGDVTVVPEPSTYSLVASALAVFGLLRRTVNLKVRSRQ
jgi:hypothetical protein